MPNALVLPDSISGHPAPWRGRGVFDEARRPMQPGHT
jgi:hypothetical protein